MKDLNRTFTITESGKSAKMTDIKVPTNVMMEVIDLTTRAILHLKASEVSIYRHTLRMHGKIFNIMNVRESW